MSADTLCVAGPQVRSRWRSVSVVPAETRLDVTFEELAMFSELARELHCVSRGAATAPGAIADTSSDQALSPDLATPFMLAGRRPEIGTGNEENVQKQKDALVSFSSISGGEATGTLSIRASSSPLGRAWRLEAGVQTRLVP